ncbi:hypothetical protein OCK74_24495 [Chitinophagaceae bacterium LB-8]|uniref:Uncharacterized protein n=1 Tax=Paraflavisolibacter caeni TaxID=2982496 RepID=A0A9X2Y0S3_9BACT|nr:hypothetical protein [Paraflavisolibacter caeni]MCU7552302.1 hypothetical protein [Paraflavisolibacter caeni]
MPSKSCISVVIANNTWTGGYGATSQRHYAFAQGGTSVATRGNQWEQTVNFTTAGGTTAGYRTYSNQSGVIYSEVYVTNRYRQSSNFTSYKFVIRLFCFYTKSILHGLIFILTLLLHQPAVGQQAEYNKTGAPGTWRIIGTAEAQFTVDHDGIIVGPPYDNFRKLQIKVTEAPLRLIKLQVIYEDGEPDILPVRIYIAQGGASRPLNLSGNGTRHIRRIDFWYDTGGSRTGRAKVTVLGMK